METSRPFSKPLEQVVFIYNLLQRFTLLNIPAGATTFNQQPESKSRCSLQYRLSLLSYYRTTETKEKIGQEMFRTNMNVMAKPNNYLKVNKTMATYCFCLPACMSNTFSTNGILVALQNIRMDLQGADTGWKYRVSTILKLICISLIWHKSNDTKLVSVNNRTAAHSLPYEWC